MWIHWWSPVTSANSLMRCWSISCHSPTPSSWPIRPTASSMEEITFIGVLPSGCCCESDLSHAGFDVRHHVRAPGVKSPMSEARLTHLHQRQIDRLGGPAFGGKPRQHVLHEEVGHPDLAGVERLVVLVRFAVERLQGDLGLPQEKPADQEVAHRQQERQ